MANAYSINQGRIFGEAVTGGCVANKYIVTDPTVEVDVVGDTQGRKSKLPLFIVKEDSNCCGRLCCPGNQSLLADVYLADVARPGKTCCGCYTGHQYGIVGEPVMTLEREGCCSKCLGCPILSTICMNDMFMHAGKPAGLKPGQTKAETGQYLGRSSVCFRWRHDSACVVGMASASFVGLTVCFSVSPLPLATDSVGQPLLHAHHRGKRTTERWPLLA